MLIDANQIRDQIHTPMRVMVGTPSRSFVENDAGVLSAILAAGPVSASVGRFERIHSLIVKYPETLLTKTVDSARKEAADAARVPQSLPVRHAHLVALTAATTVSRHERAREIILAAAQGSHTDSEWLETVERYGNKCLRCNVSGHDSPLTKDHVTALSQGGTNYVSNLQPLCASCNAWKGSREIDFRGPRAFAVTAA